MELENAWEKCEYVSSATSCECTCSDLAQGKHAFKVQSFCATLGMSLGLTCILNVCTMHMYRITLVTCNLLR